MRSRPTHQHTNSNTKREYAPNNGPLITHSRSLLGTRFLIYSERQRTTTDLSRIPFAGQITRTIRELGGEGGEVGRAIAFPIHHNQHHPQP